VNPMITTRRSHGYVNKYYPILDEYSSMVALLDLGDGNEFVLDATEDYLPFGLPAFEQLNTLGLVMRSTTEYYWYFVQAPIVQKDAVFINGSMDENGQINGEISIVNSGYSAQSLIEEKTANRGNALNEWVKTRIPNATIESIKDSADAAMCKFYFKVKFSAQAISDNDGNMYLSVPAIYGKATNPFVDNERTADVDFGFKTRSDVVMQIKIPETYVVDSIVPSLSLGMYDTSIVFGYDAVALEGQVVIRQKTEYFKSIYQAKNYPTLYNFMQKYQGMKARPVVLKKKSK